MRDKVVDKIMYKIEINNKDIDKVKLAEIRYGLQGLYTLITKSFVTIFLAFLLDIVYEYFIFILFYIPLRSVGFGTHAKTNIHCWIFSTLFLLGLPFIFSYFKIGMITKIIIWSICFINYIIFSPADTKKRPMINKKRKLKFKFVILLFSILYLFLILNLKSISNLILGAIVLEALLVNPIGYILMGEKVRFRLNDLNIFKLN